MLNGASTPSAAAATWGVGTGNVHYYKKSLQDQGRGVSPIYLHRALWWKIDAVSLARCGGSVLTSVYSKAGDWDAYGPAYVMAGPLVFAGKSLRAAADEASAKHGSRIRALAVPSRRWASQRRQDFDHPR